LINKREDSIMAKPTSQQQLSEKDRLITRPDEPLPTPLDPASPEARGYPTDPKPVPKSGQGDPDATDPAADDVGRSA
jgi:hypothetical protein